MAPLAWPTSAVATLLAVVDRNLAQSRPYNDNLSAAMAGQNITKTEAQCNTWLSKLEKGYGWNGKGRRAEHLLALTTQGSGALVLSAAETSAVAAARVALDGSSKGKRKRTGGFEAEAEAGPSKSAKPGRLATPRSARAKSPQLTGGDPKQPQTMNEVLENFHRDMQSHITTQTKRERELEARVAALESQLAKANARISLLEGQHGEQSASDAEGSSTLSSVPDEAELARDHESLSLPPLRTPDRPVRDVSSSPSAHSPSESLMKRQQASVGLSSPAPKTPTAPVFTTPSGPSAARRRVSFNPEIQYQEASSVPDTPTTHGANQSVSDSLGISPEALTESSPVPRLRPDEDEEMMDAEDEEEDEGGHNDSRGSFFQERSFCGTPPG